MNTKNAILKTMFAGILGLWLQLLLHELGHALLAIIRGNEVEKIKIGIMSYAEIKVENTASIPIISLGAFILPLCVVIIFQKVDSKRYFINMTRSMVCMVTLIQLLINIFAMLSKNVSETMLNTFDLYIFISNTEYNKYMVIAICFMVVILIGSMEIKNIIRVLKYV